ncbi:MAG: hypothetical protein K0S44_3028 [Bacteroidetes bacterium]|jgi:photosystem II stability/assembly factor-like uncharacterized protein|nr:hypothetical protein [Bacteroidota bacterium]
MKKILFLILLFYSLIGKGQWQQTNGPLGCENGRFFKIDSSLYLTSFHSGYFVSNDKGNTWEFGNLMFQGAQIDFIAANNTFLFLCSQDSGIYRSPDQGLTWTKIVSNLPFTYYSFKGMVANDTLLGVSFYNSIYYSLDNGNSWILSTNSFSGPLTQSVNKYMVAAGPGTYTSYDMISWTTPGQSSISGSFLESQDSLVATGSWGGGLYLSRDLSTTWTRINLPGDSMISGISIVQDTIAVAGYNGVYTSFDRGYTWLCDTMMEHAALDIHYQYNAVLISSYKQIFKRSDNVWSLSNIGLVGSWADQMYSFGNNLYVRNRNEIQMTSDHGNTWQDCDSIVLNSDRIFRTDSLILAFYFNKVFRSENSGSTWQVNFPATGHVSHVAANGTKIYLSTDTGPYYSIDRGVTWVSLQGNLPASNQNAFTIYAEDNFLLLSTQYGFYRSVNNGVNWTQVGMSFGYMGYVMKVVRSGLYLVAAAQGIQGGLMRSSNNGVSWYNITPSASSSYYGDITAIGNSIVAINHFVGCFVSNNNGSNWMMDNTGLIYYRLHGIEVMDDNFYLSTYGHGVFKRSFADLNVVNVNEIYKIQEAEWSIFPNPSNSEEINIRSEKGIKKIEVFSVNGMKLISKNVDCVEHTIFIRESGVYFVVITRDDIVSTKKLVVIK